MNLSIKRHLIFLFFFFPLAYSNDPNDTVEDYDYYNDYDTSVRIIGGKNVTKFPSYLVSVALNGIHICGGSIITKKWVLSAAHCFFTVDGLHIETRFFSIVAGTVDLAEEAPKIYRSCVNIAIHRKYKCDLSGGYDLALVNLSEALNLRPIPIASHEDVELSLKSYKWTMCTTMGWGKYTNEPGKERLSNQLMQLQLPLINAHKCREEYKKIKRFWKFRLSRKRHLCTYRLGEDICQGDSGGPLICNNHLYGVIIWGLGCNYTAPAVYTRTDLFVEWMYEVISGKSVASITFTTQYIYLSCLIIVIQLVNIFKF